LGVPVSPIPDRLVYVVDDDEAVRESMIILLETENVPAQGYPSARALLEEADLSCAGFLILDMHMPGLSGIELLTELRRRGVETPAIILTGRGDGSVAQAARQLGATMLAKPPDDDELLPLVFAALGRSK
jgi:FixJ family two-component response regulator